MSIFHDMVFELGGAPVSGARFTSPWAKHYFVDATLGSDYNSGITPKVALATIQAAVTKCVRGDVVYIRPQAYVVGSGFARYTEDVSTILTQSDVSIIGITNTRNPEFGVRWTFATAQCLDVIGPALHVENIGFFAEAATYSILIENDGASNLKRGSDGTTFYNCVIKGKTVAVLSGGTGLTFDSCRFSSAYNGVVAQLLFSCSANPGRHLKVRGCEWTDGNGTAPSAACISILPPATEILIDSCRFPQLPTGNVYIATAGANYGLISNCFFNHDDLDTDAEITLGSGVKAVACYDQAGLATTA